MDKITLTILQEFYIIKSVGEYNQICSHTDNKRVHKRALKKLRSKQTREIKNDKHRTRN